MKNNTENIKLPENHPFFRQLDAYYLDLKRQGKSTHTITAYYRDLVLLSQLLPHTEHPVRRDFLHALKRLSQQNYHERSLARILSSWRQYCSFLIDHNLRSDNPVDGIKAPRAKERLPKALDRELLNHLLDNTLPENELDLRDYAIFELMYGSGLRVGEIHQLNLTDLSLDSGWVHIVGKGNKHRQIPLTNKSIEALHQYLKERIPAKDGKALFTGQHGTRLSTAHIALRLKKWAQHNHSPQHISPHMLRHSYASHVLQSSQDIRAVQELLGHSNLSTTQIYTKLDFDHLARAYDAAHPRAKRQSNSQDEEV